MQLKTDQAHGDDPVQCSEDTSVPYRPWKANGWLSNL